MPIELVADINLLKEQVRAILPTDIIIGLRDKHKLDLRLIHSWQVLAAHCNQCPAGGVDLCPQCEMPDCDCESDAKDSALGALIA